MNEKSIFNQCLRKNSEVLWTISLIQDKHPEAQTKQEFADMVKDVVNTEAIQKVTLCLADDLQRFRLMIEHDLDENEAKMQCQKMAQIWYQDNAQALEQLKSAKELTFFKLVRIFKLV